MMMFDIEQVDKKLSDKELGDIFVLFSKRIDWVNQPQHLNQLSDKAQRALEDFPTDNYKIKFLSLISKQIKDVPFLFKLHFVYLEWSIKLHNYKQAKQFIENNSIVYQIQIMQNKNDMKDNRVEKYFYYCGIIYSAYWDYPEALRYFDLASKSDRGHHLKGEIDKQINIIKCRTGQGYNFDDYTKDEDIFIVTHQNDVPEKENLKIINKKRDTYNKLPIVQQNGERWGINNLEFLTNKLNLFWINEEREYIQFKSVDKSYDNLNETLLKRQKLISNMINK